MNKITRFVIWICSKFTREEIEQIINQLSDVLADRNPEVKPKDDFQQKHPHYRKFFVDPKAPLTERAEKAAEKLDWKKLLAAYHQLKGHPLKPINHRSATSKVPKDMRCPTCSAPSSFLYFNDGEKRSQLKCKICSSVSQIHPRHRLKAPYFCPHCHHSLYLWKVRKEVSIFKCDNDRCPAYLSNKAQLNAAEKLLARVKSSQFKLRYQYRAYHFTQEELTLSAPKKGSSIFKIRNSLNTLCLALTFHVSFAISARKTALILREVFSLPASYQTVLNYTHSAAYYCHKFNLAYKGEVDSLQAGDETYINISGKKAYTFLFISSLNRKITSSHVADSREPLPAIIAIKEAIRTAQPQQNITLITDGNPSYPAAIHFINQSHCPSLTHKKVIGLQNLDSESEELRPFKQLVERLNRTYKFHTRTACGFNSKNGAVALTTLFVTHYNFLRPHHSLNYAVPAPLEELENIPTFQGKWAKILHLSFELESAA